jgi:hypothetical protein
VGLDDGKPIDVERWRLGHSEDDKFLEKQVTKWKAREDSARNMTYRAGRTALFLTVAGMVMLIALAWKNF